DHHLQPGDADEVRLGVLRVIVPAPDPSADGGADHHADRVLAPGPIPVLGELVHDLVVRRPDEVRELDLRDGDEAVHGHPHGRADDTALAQGRIDHARVAELVEQTRGHAEHAADLPDVFTQQDYALVPTHRNP